jgi:hypothetical protein
MLRLFPATLLLILGAAGGALDAATVPTGPVIPASGFSVTVIDDSSGAIMRKPAANGGASRVPLDGVTSLLVRQINDPGQPTPSTLGLLKIGDDRDYCAQLQQDIQAGGSVAVVLAFSNGQWFRLEGITKVTCQAAHSDFYTEGDDLDDFQTEKLEFTFTNVVFPPPAPGGEPAAGAGQAPGAGPAPATSPASGDGSSSPANSGGAAANSDGTANSGATAPAPAPAPAAKA